MDTERGGPRWVETVVGIEEEDGVRPRHRGEQAVQECRDARPLGASEEMGVAKRQTAEERIEGRQPGRERIDVRGEVRCPADRERRRQCGNGWGELLIGYVRHVRHRLRSPVFASSRVLNTIRCSTNVLILSRMGDIVGPKKGGLALPMRALAYPESCSGGTP